MVCALVIMRSHDDQCIFPTRSQLRGSRADLHILHAHLAAGLRSHQLCSACKLVKRTSAQQDIDFSSIPLHPTEGAPERHVLKHMLLLQSSVAAAEEGCGICCASS